MKLLTYLSTAVVALSISTAALAEIKSPHSVGLQLGGGSMEYKDKKERALVRLICITTINLHLFTH